MDLAMEGLDIQEGGKGSLVGAQIGGKVVFCLRVH